jgi:predicted CoA-binding protein
MSTENTEKKTVVVLGASAKPERYSNRAVALLLEKGYHVIPVNPAQPVVHGIPCLPGLARAHGTVHTLSVYVSPEISSRTADEILALNPARVIFNPNTENSELKERLEKKGIAVVEACTLVMLNTGQF